MARQQVQRHVVAAYDHHRILNCLHRTKQVHADLRARIQPFREARNLHYPVRAHQRHNDARAALHRRRHQFLPDPPQPHPQELVLSYRRKRLARNRCAHLVALGSGKPKLLLNERLDEQLTGQRRRHWIARYAQRRLALHHAKHNRMPRANSRPMHDQLAQRFHHPRRIVLATRRRPSVHQHYVMLRDGIPHGIEQPVEVVRYRLPR